MLESEALFIRKAGEEIRDQVNLFFFVYESSLQLSKCILMIYNFMNMRNILVLLETKAGESMS